MNAGHSSDAYPGRCPCHRPAAGDRRSGWRDDAGHCFGHGDGTPDSLSHGCGLQVHRGGPAAGEATGGSCEGRGLPGQRGKVTGIAVPHPVWSQRSKALITWHAMHCWPPIARRLFPGPHSASPHLRQPAPSAGASRGKSSRDHRRAGGERARASGGGWGGSASGRGGDSAGNGLGYWHQQRLRHRGDRPGHHRSGNNSSGDLHAIRRGGTAGNPHGELRTPGAEAAGKQAVWQVVLAELSKQHCLLPAAELDAQASSVTPPHARHHAGTHCHPAAREGKAWPDNPTSPAGTGAVASAEGTALTTASATGTRLGARATCTSVLGGHRNLHQ